MNDQTAKSAEEIRLLRTLHPDMRERYLARIHAIGEATRAYASTICQKR